MYRIVCLNIVNFKKLSRNWEHVQNLNKQKGNLIIFFLLYKVYKIESKNIL